MATSLPSKQNGKVKQCPFGGDNGKGVCGTHKTKESVKNSIEKAFDR